MGHRMPWVGRWGGGVGVCHFPRMLFTLSDMLSLVAIAGIVASVWTAAVIRGQRISGLRRRAMRRAALVAARLEAQRRAAIADGVE
jgi:hypothetical protein